MSKVVHLLSSPANFAVVQLPGRSFPGVVFQGDTIKATLGRLRRLKSLAHSLENDDFNVELDELIEQYQEVIRYYESILAKKGLAKPY